MRRSWSGYWFLMGCLVVCGGTEAQVLGFPESGVNVYFENAQTRPALTMDGLGRGWIAWTSSGPLEGSLRSRRIAGGQVQGDEILVDQDPDCLQAGSASALSPNSEPVLFWSACHGADGYATYVRRYSVLGLPISDPIRLLDDAGEVLLNGLLDVLMFETGEYVSIHGAYLNDYSDNAIFGHRFSADDVPIGGLFRISQDPSELPGENKRWARAAKTGAQEFVVVWNNEASDQDGDGSGIFGRRFRSDGVALGDEFQVNQYFVGYQIDPDVASDAQGNFVVVWASYGQDGHGWGSYGRRYSAAGVPLGPEIRINVETDSSEWYPVIGMDSAGSFLVLWNTFDHSAPVGGTALGAVVLGRYFAADGTPKTGELLLTQSLDYGYEVPAAVAVSDAGLALVAFANDTLDSDNSGIRARELVLPCEADGRTLCLSGGRFLVRADWAAVDGSAGFASSLPLTEESGALTFFSPDNLELVVKVLDGCGTNGRYWVFASGLTDVEVGLTVTDRWTGAVWSHQSPSGTRYEPTFDINAFDGCGATEPPALYEFTAGEAAAEPASPTGTVDSSASAPGGYCGLEEGTLCLQNGRFRAAAHFATAGGLVGFGVPAPLSDQSGTFWFFWPENLEIYLKILDGCGVNGRYWLYAAGLTDVEVDLAIEDTLTGASYTIHNPSGSRFQPLHDVEAFAGCP